MGCFPQMIGVMMAVGVQQHLDGHAEVARGRPDRHSGLHQPRCRRVPQRVRCDVASCLERPASLVAVFKAVLIDLTGLLRHSTK